MASEAYWKKRDAKLTKRAKRIYKVVFNKALPKQWRFIWYFMGATDWHCKQIMLVDGLEDRRALDTLCHEFVHVKFPKKRHGKEFDKMVRKMVRVAECVK